MNALCSNNVATAVLCYTTALFTECTVTWAINRLSDRRQAYWAKTNWETRFGQLGSTLSRRRDSTVELSHVAPVGSRDSVCNFLCCWAIEVGDKWRQNDVSVEKAITIDDSSRSQTAMESIWSVCKLSIRIRRQSSWASCEFCSHRRCRRDSTWQLSRIESHRHRRCVLDISGHVIRAKCKLC